MIKFNVEVTKDQKHFRIIEVMAYSPQGAFRNIYNMLKEDEYVYQIYSS